MNTNKNASHIRESENLREEIAKLIYRSHKFFTDDSWPAIWAFHTNPENCAKAGCEWTVALAADEIIRRISTLMGEKK